jgi:hypothetical protein
MNRHSSLRIVRLIALVSMMIAHSQISSAAPTGEAPMTQRASGTFDVKIAPQAEDKAEGAPLGRMSLDKTWRGEFEGTSRGEMLTAMGMVEGSAVYVAIERVTGMLQGRKGTFALAHMGTMMRGAQQLTINIVPDSGTDQLTGIAGSMTIRIEAGGKHFYELSYTLP